MNISQLLESLKDPNISLSVSEKLIAGVSVAILSMVIVFIVLVLIALIVKLLQNEKQKPVAKVQEVSTSQEIESKPSNEDIGELVSVITAAIAATTGQSTNNIIVKKITRTNNSRTSWEKMTKNTTK